MVLTFASVALTATLGAATVVQPRTLPNSPSGNYTPANVACPSNLNIRSATSGLSQNETAWLAVRRQATIQPMIDFLTRANISDFSASDYINKVSSNSQNLTNLPNVGIAVSGGGYRALMNGAGFLSAADSRTPGSTGAGGIGGLLQSATYLAGLSGGSWLVGSLFANDFVSVNAQKENSSLWSFENTIFEGPSPGGLLGVANTASYWSDIQDQVSGKKDAGFETSITDYWGRALSYQLVGARDGGPGFVYSGIATKSNFQQGQTPFPIIVADGRRPGTKIVDGNSTVFEFNPFEMGSFDPNLYGFVPTQYLGTNFSGGSVVPSSSGGRCVHGFDQIGFIMGTSSTLFNQFLLQNLSLSSIPSFVTSAITGVLESIDDDNNDIAQYVPNPFFGFNNDSNPTASAIELDLVDGGEDLQNIPLVPLLQPSRAVDVIFAVDSSADTTSIWPNGTAISATFLRSNSPMANGTLFPSVPDVNTMVNLGLNNRPTFFGCNTTNFTVDAGQRVPPLLVYIPNAPYTAPSNVSTFTPSYSLAQRNDIILNGLNVASMGNGTMDSEWPACMACAILSRSLERTGTAIPSTCSSCFSRYCWDGSLNSTTPAEYQPAFKIGNQATAESSASRVAGVGVLRMMVVVMAAVSGLLITV